MSGRAQELFNAGLKHRNAGEFGKAVVSFRECLALRQRVLGEEHKSTLITKRNLERAVRSSGGESSETKATGASSSFAALQQRSWGGGAQVEPPPPPSPSKGIPEDLPPHNAGVGTPSWAPKHFAPSDLEVCPFASPD